MVISAAVRAAIRVASRAAPKRRVVRRAVKKIKKRIEKSRFDATVGKAEDRAVSMAPPGLHHTGLETSKSPPKKLEDMAGRYKTLGGWLRKDKKEYFGVNRLPPKKRPGARRMGAKDLKYLERNLATNVEKGEIKWRQGALFQRTPKRKADPFDKITKNFEGYNPAVFNAKLGVPFKKGFHGNWMSKIDYDQLKPRKLAVQKSGDAVETAAGIAAAGAWTPILGFHITGQYDKTKKPKSNDKKPGKR